MSLIVQKFGGSSVADAQGIKRVAQRIVSSKRDGNQVAVVVSAMGDTTDELIELAKEVAPNAPGREMDMLLTSGERISVALLAMAIHDLGVEARSYTGSQAGLITDSKHGKARIVDVNPARVKEAISAEAIPIVAGFQGVSQDTKDITTLGRGGSDTTAVALAVALGADVCEIYTDVDGVFTADPRVVPQARKVDRVTFEEMLELAASGAKVLALRCVEYARRADLPIHVRSSFADNEGTWVVSAETKGSAMEQPIIAGVAHDLGDSKVTVVGVPDRPGEAADIFDAIAEAGVNVDMIVQNISSAATGRTDVTFTCPALEVATALAALNAKQEKIDFIQLLSDDEVAKVSLIGAGMRAHPGVSANFFRALSDAKVNIEMISTSEIRISVVVRANDAERAVQAVHRAFGLDGDGEAVIYGGSGR